MSIFWEKQIFFDNFLCVIGLTYLTYVPPLAICYYEEKHHIYKELSMGIRRKRNLLMIQFFLVYKRADNLLELPALWSY